MAVEETTTDEPFVPSPEAQERLAELDAEFAASQPAPEPDGVDETEIDTELEPPADPYAWISDDVREHAASLGRDEAWLKRFKDADAFEAAALFYDSELAEEGRRLLEQPAPAPVAPPEPIAHAAAPGAAPTQPSRVTPPASPAPPTPVVDPTDPLEQHLAAIRAEYADEAPALTNALAGLANVLRAERAKEAAELREQVGKLHQFAEYQAQQILHQQHQHQVQQFNQMVNALGHADLLGDDAQEMTDELWDNRRKVWDHATLLHAALSQRAGQNVPLTKVLVNRAFKTVFADQLANKKLAAQREAIRKQAGKRLGTPGRKLNPPSPRPTMLDNPLDDPDFMAQAREIMQREAS